MLCLSSVQSLSRVRLLRPHEPQHARPPCPSPAPGVYPSPCPLSRWCHPTISSSVVPFSSCFQSFPASGSFQMSLFTFFVSSGQSIEFQLQQQSFQYRRFKRHGLDPWVRKIPWRRVWQPTPVFLPGESPRTEEPGRLQSIGSQRDTT